MRVSIAFLTLPFFAILAIVQEPSPAPTPPTPPVATPPATPPGPPPPIVPASPLHPGQPIYGEIVDILPAHRIAMLEAGQILPVTDPLVDKMAVLLSRLTEGFVEDAPRIAELTSNIVQEIRARNRPASPFEMLEAALRWPRSHGTRGDLPRQYENYAAIYRVWRVRGGKDHSQALSLMKIPPAPTPVRPDR